MTDANTPLKAPQQRVGPLADLSSFVRELGGDPAEVFLGTGIAPDALQANDFIPVALFLQILDRAASVTGRQDVALLLGLRQSPDKLGPLGRLMSLAPTLGQALGDFVSLQIANSRGASVYLHRMGEEFAFGIGLYDPAHRTSSLVYELALGTGLAVIRHLTDGQVEPAEVMLIRRAPDFPAPYFKATRCKVSFDQPQSCIVLPARSLAHRLKTADAAGHARLLKEVNEHLLRAPWGVSGQVRHALRPLLLLGGASLAEIAEAVGLQVRTLERHLKQEGTSFDVLKDEVRLAVARELLSLTSLPVGEIAASLGYGSHSSFVHAFQRWTGTTPTAWRQAFLSGGAG